MFSGWRCGTLGHERCRRQGVAALRAVSGNRCMEHGIKVAFGSPKDTRSVMCCAICKLLQSSLVSRAYFSGGKLTPDFIRCEDCI